MELPKSQHQIMLGLKTRGPQSVKILSKQLDMTTMGVRQHLSELEKRGHVCQTGEEKQTRGRPVHLWKLSQQGHSQFADSHSQLTLELINLIRTDLGEKQLEQLIEHRGAQELKLYQQQLQACGDELEERINRLAQLRSKEGYMAEVRLLPNAWLLIENHCPICSAARQCEQFCKSELSMFQQLLSGVADVERSDHLLTGSRRCAYKITRTAA